MRAVQPTRHGAVSRDGGTLHYDIYEHLGPSEAPTLVLLPAWNLVDSRAWKMQIPYLSRHYRVVVYDAAGAGRSTADARPARHGQRARLADAVAVIEDTCDSPVLAVGASMGGSLAYSLQAYRPDLIAGTVAIGSDHPFRVDPPGWREEHAPYDPVTNPHPQGWSKIDGRYMIADTEDFLAWTVPHISTDPHSSKVHDDVMTWARDADIRLAAAAITDNVDLDLEDWRRRLASSTIPALIMHGTADPMVHPDCARLAAQTIPRSRLILDEGVGHAPAPRHPVRINHRIRDFADEAFGRTGPRSVEATAWAAPASDVRRVLYLSSPIGLGHARRDVAIAKELAARVGDVQIDWLAQDPLTRVLDASGHRIHPASRLLANESAHFEQDCGEHALDVFESFRDMAEILVHNFHVADEVVADGAYDLVIGDEAWDVDHWLHEDPRLKHTTFAWLTDFVGQLPMPRAGERQRQVAADYNLEMLEHVENHPHIRDASIFVGDPDDVVPGTFGPGLPSIREWTEEHFEFSGYITGFDPHALGDRERLRAELGFGPREKVCIVAVGGTGVGRSLIKRVVAAVPAARRDVPELRVIVVTGPRIDPATLPQVPGVEYRSYVDRLYRWLAACDVAIVQGGLTTTMELTAAKVPFIYVPLRDHFEQNIHVRARLDRYRAGRCMDYDELTPGAVTAALVDLLGSEPDYLDVSTDGAARAASRIATLL